MKHLVLLFCILTAFDAHSQECIKLWRDGHMPNSRAMELSHKEENELIWQVESPVIYPFLPSNRENSGAAVLIFPAGGYAKLAYNVAGFQLAKWFNTIGVNAFVVIYRLPTSPDLLEPYKAPIQDAQRAMKIIRSRAQEWEIDPDKIGVMGCSSGGHLATMISTCKEDYSITGDSLDHQSSRPNFTILVSPVVSMSSDWAHQGSIANLLGSEPSQAQRELFSAERQVDKQTPPAFVVHAQDDHVVPVQNSIAYYSALTQQGIKGCSLHIFPTGKHSIALRNKSSMLNQWSSLCEEWLIERAVIPPK